MNARFVPSPARPEYYTNLGHACKRISLLHNQDNSRRFKVRRMPNGLWRMYVSQEVV